jgi:DNA-binding IclR family transcriptional regulator
MASTADVAGRYAAPALEKGLDILEVLAGDPAGLSQQVLAERLGRSVGEIFRMLEVLVRRGWLTRDADTGRYALSPKLFDLAHRHPPTRQLLEAALPEMRRLADATGQSVHLSVRHADRLLVLAQAEGFSDMGFSVKPGSSYGFRADRVSARVLTAFAAPDQQAAMLRLLGAGMAPQLRRIAREGSAMVPSATIAGVTDLCAPLRDASDTAVAALTLPFLRRRGAAGRADAARDALVEAARAISTAIGWRGR